MITAQVFHWIQTLKGDLYIPANEDGASIAHLPDDATGCGILWSHPDNETYKLGLVPRRIRRTFLGFVRFGSRSWSFEVYGLDYVAEAEILAKKMSEFFHIPIETTLASADEKLEFLPIDRTVGKAVRSFRAVQARVSRFSLRERLCGMFLGLL